jgi:hypothetical protein
MAKSGRLKGQRQRKNTSKRELEVGDLLQSIFPTAKFYSEYPYSRFTDTQKNMSCDIWCPTFNIAFEIQGEGHTAPIYYDKTSEGMEKAQQAFREQKVRDDVARGLCKEANVRLIEIWHAEWDKLKTAEEKRTFLMEQL